MCFLFVILDVKYVEVDLIHTLLLGRRLAALARCNLLGLTTVMGGCAVEIYAGNEDFMG